MDDFEWRTEEDEPLPEALTPTVVSRAGRQLWPFLVVTLLLLVTAGLLAGRQVRRQLSVAEGTAAADVRHAFQLVQQAARRADGELYVSLLDRSDSGWLAGQQESVVHGVLDDRSFAGLMPHEDGLEIADVTLAPDLAAAELRWRRSFTVDVGGGGSVTAAFEYTDFFLLREGRWLLAPPPAEFWGPWERNEREFLTLVYPQRDAAVGRRLAADLDAMLAALCRHFEDAAECRPGGKVQVRLGTEANRLAQLALRLSSPLSGSPTSGPTHQIELPAPTLLGTPVDENGYQALYRAYGRYLARQMSTNILNRRAPVTSYQSYLAFELLLHEIGLLTWPPAAAVAAQARQSTLPLPTPELVVLCPGAAGNDLHRYSADSGLWQTAVTGENIYQIAPVAGGRAVALAAQPLAGGRPRYRVMLYSRRGSTPVLDQVGLISLDPMHPSLRVSEPASARLQIRLIGGADEPTWRWLDVPACLAGDCRLQVSGNYLQWAPGGAHTLVLSSEGNRLRMFLGDGRGAPLRELNVVQAAWLSADQYAGVDMGVQEFVKLGDLLAGEAATGTAAQDAVMLSTSGRVVLFSVNGEEAHPLLTGADLLASLPAGGGWPLQFRTGSVRAVPNRPDQFLIEANGFAVIPDRAFDGNRARSYLFLADTAGDSRLLWSGTNYPYAAFSSDGRRLAWIDVDDERWLVVLDLERDERRAFDMGAKPFFEQVNWPSFSWSGDGRWLVVLHDGLLYLVAPEFGYRHVVIPAAPGCTQAAWLE
jgi:hypothetical protein